MVSRFGKFCASAAVLLTVVCVQGFSPARADDAPAYTPSGKGTRLLESAGVVIRMLVEEANLGGREVELGEITFPVEYGHGPEHTHGRLEVIYVLSGVLGHTVNGALHRLEPGMVGIVRPGDTVAHAVLSEEPVRALLVWAPGGEAQALIDSFGFAERALPE